MQVLSAELYDRPTHLVGGEAGLRNWITMFGGPYYGIEEALLQQAERELRPKLHTCEQWVADYR